MSKRRTTRRFLSAIARKGTAFRQDRRGAALPMMVAGLIPAIAAIGSAIDIGRLYLVRSQMQVGVDAAALAGARAFGLTDRSAGSRDSQVDIYFSENFQPGFLGSDPVNPDRQFRTVRGVNVTTVTATTDLPMMFMQLFGIGPRRITAVATAELQPRPLEVMVVLDDTGSMSITDVGGGQRMDALKDAMYGFLDILHQGSTRRSELALGFTTYTVTTNVGHILREADVPVAPVDGFTNVGFYTHPTNQPNVNSEWPRNPLAWKGCVMNDQSIHDLSAVPGDVENDFRRGAWDVNGSLPGDLNGHPAVAPYLYPPVSDTAAAYATDDRVDTEYVGRGNNNFYLLSPNGNLDIGQRLANSEAYKSEFYAYYIGLNTNPANPRDDVIVKPDGSYYDPGAGGPYLVNYRRIPFIGNTRHWRQPNPAYGYTTLNGRADTTGNYRTGYSLRQPSPNYQCPEPGMSVQYGRAKSVYEDFVRYHNTPVNPGSGTLHHIGLLWGYRLLARSDKFTRVNPLPDEKPIRALVFMTDGQTVVGSNASWFGAYGAQRHKQLTANGPTTAQVMRRFGKVCQAAKNDDIAVYIVSLRARVPEFATCAGSRYYQTNDAATIRSAFEQIAVDLVDLHLTQ